MPGMRERRNGKLPMNTRRFPSAEMELERLLRLATGEPGWRPLFYRRLLDAAVLVPAVLPATGSDVVPAGSLIHLVRWQRNDGVWVAPFFTSIRAARRGAPGTAHCVTMSCREFFESVLGVPLHLNPNCEYGREFTPDEVGALLQTGSMVDGAYTVLDKDLDIQLTPLDVLPPFATSLRILYATDTHVRAAYMVGSQILGDGELPGLLIGLELSNVDGTSLFRDTATVLRDIDPGIGVDAVRIDPHDDGLGQRIAAHAAPFYVRSNRRH